VITLLADKQTQMQTYEHRSLLCSAEEHDRLKSILDRNEEPRSLQATLAALSDVKQTLCAQLTDASARLNTIATLLKLTNRDDEPLLYELFKENLFASGKGQIVAIHGTELAALVNFYLGYCTSNEKLVQASTISIGKVELRSLGFFLPLLDDWFIRPLYFIDKLDQSAKESLVCAILAFAKAYF